MFASIPQLIPDGIVHWFFYGPLLLIALDLLTGIASAIRNKTFQWNKFFEFLGRQKDLDYYLYVCIAVLVIAVVVGLPLATTVDIALGMGPLSLKIGKSVYSNITEFFPQNAAMTELEHMVVDPAMQTAETVPATVTANTWKPSGIGTTSSKEITAPIPVTPGMLVPSSYQYPRNL